MKKLSGFSLMEMMIVLLIVSIVAAASAPMINKKLVGVATDKSPWVWVGNSDSIAYNLQGSATQTANIGTTNAHPNAGGARLYLDTRTDASANYVPQLSLGRNSDSYTLKLLSAKNNIWFSTERTTLDNVQNSVVIGSQASAANHNVVAIGHNSYAEDVRSVAIGADTRLSGATEESTAIGSGANIGGSYATAIGRRANARGTNSVAIGANSYNNATNATAIGYLANARGTNSVAIGANSYNYATNATAVGYLANARGDNSLSIGSLSYNYAKNATAVGHLANARGENSISIGSNSYNYAKNSISMGHLANARGDESISIGARSNVSAWNATAVGERCIAGYGATAMGSEANAASSHSVALGYQARTGNSLSTGPSNDSGAIAIGPRANAKGQDAIAIGTNTLANFNNSVAIGFKAEAKTSDQIVLGTSSSTVYIPGKLVVGTPRGIYLKTDDGSWKWKNSWVRIYGVTKTYDADRYVAGVEQSTPNLSDRRLKTVGKAFIGGLNEIKKLEVFNYTFKSDKSKTPRVGVMAQDLQKIFPNAVVKGDDGFLRIRMEDMFYALINAVKEIDVRVTKLEKENLELKKQNQVLMKRLTELEKKLK